MRAQLASDYAEDRAGDRWDFSPVIQSVASGAQPEYERSVYFGAKRMNPLAAAASIAVAFGAFASFLYIGSGHHHRHHHDRHHRLTVMQLADLQPPPPPPSHQAPEKVRPEYKRPPTVVTPPSVVQLPALPTVIATVAKSAPIAPITGSVQAPVTASASPAQSTENIGDISARMISATAPSYPLESRRAREQGTVVLSVVLGTDGRVATLSITRSSGFGRLDRAALNAVRRWRWAPLIRNGSPASVQGLVTIPFVLHV